MAHHFFICSHREMLEKAKHDLALVQADSNAYTIFNFFVTLFHVKDYVENGTSVGNATLNAFQNTPDFQVCRSLCNRGKHLELKTDGKYPCKPVNQRLEGGSGMLGFGAIGEGPISSCGEWALYCDNKRVDDPIALGQRIIDAWEQFFANNGI